jgi:hypothetical protein
VLYQPKFEVPEDLYTTRSSAGGGARTKYDWDTVRFSKIQPDYVVVLRVESKRRLVVVDAKASSRVKQSHRIQVGFYSWMLRRFLRREEQARELPVLGLGDMATYGAVWRPPDKAGAQSLPETFGVTDLEEELERLMVKIVAEFTPSKHDLANQGRAEGKELCKGQDWLLQHACAGCDFEPTCRQAAPLGRPSPAMPALVGGPGRRVCTIAHAARSAQRV